MIVAGFEPAIFSDEGGNCKRNAITTTLHDLGTKPVKSLLKGISKSEYFFRLQPG